MRRWLPVLLFGAALLPLASVPPATAQSRVHFGVTVHRGGQFRRFGPGVRLPAGRFEGFCCVALPGDNGDTPGIIVIDAAPPPPPAAPRRPLTDLHMTVEKTPSGVIVVRGPAILP